MTTWREQQVDIPSSRALAIATRDGIIVPCVIADAGDVAACPVPGILRREHPEQETRMADYRAAYQ